MFERLNLITDNQLDEVSLEGYWFKIDQSRQIAAACELNTKMKKLNLSMVELTDDSLAVIASSLLNRQRPLEELDLSYNHLTVASEAVLFELMKAKKVLKFYLYDNSAWSNDFTAMKKLATFAREYGIGIINESPLVLNHPASFKSKNPRLAALFQPCESKEQSPHFQSHTSPHFEEKDEIKIFGIT